MGQESALPRAMAAWLLGAFLGSPVVSGGGNPGSVNVDWNVALYTLGRGRKVGFVSAHGPLEQLHEIPSELWNGGFSKAGLWEWALVPRQG